MSIAAITALMPLRHFHPNYLRKALASILTQSCRDWRLLIVVEKSDGDAFKTLLEAELADPRIELIANEGRKLAGAINTGMRYAGTDFVALVFADDLWSHDAVEVLNRYLDQYPEIDFFHSSRLIIDEDDRPISPVHHSKDKFHLDDFRFASPVKHLLCWRKEKALSIGGLDERLNSVGPDDYDFPWTMAENGATFKAVKECLYYYRDHRESYRLTTHLPLSVHKREIRRIMRKHGVGAFRAALRVAAARKAFLRQCLFRSAIDKWVKEKVGYDARQGWRDTYGQESSTTQYQDPGMKQSPSMQAYLPTASIIVAVYNAEGTLKDCIESLLGLDYPKERVEIILVNNGSTDGTMALLNQYKTAIKILHEPKRGPAAARNRGLLEAKGDVVAFTDSDCIVERNWLRNLVAPLQDDGVGIVGGKNLAQRPCNSIGQFGEHINNHDKAINGITPPYAITMNWSSRLSVLNEMEGFDDRLIRCCDVDLSYRIHQAGYTLAYQPRAIIWHKNDQALSGLFKKGYLHGLHSVRVLKKHKSFLSQFGYRRFTIASYIGILASAMNVILGDNRPFSTCDCVFKLGKKVGKFVGSMRFFYVDL
jgi:glycosyltransferase involved in cell wall biosynthesis